MNRPNRLRATWLALSVATFLSACSSVDVYDAKAPAAAHRTVSSAQAAPPQVDLTAADAHFDAGRWSEAVPLYEAAVAQDATLGKAWFRLGYALHATGQLERALVAHERATAFPAFAPIAAYNAGCAHALLGRGDEAFAALNRAVDLGLTNVAQLDGDTDLASLRADPRWLELRARITGEPADDPLRHLDFWVGDWDVKTSGGQLLGTNHITLQEGGHLILEAWTGVGGDTGQSMNYWDRDARQWKQVWVSNGGNVLHMAGSFTDGALRFRGVTMFKGGASVDQKMSLTPLEDGRVRQLIETSRDGGQTWKATFEGFYAKRAGD